jgi:nucleoside-diphosphate-sugar epimerase
MLLITGATGHSGEWFIKMLVSEKYDKRIRCTIRETSNTSYLDNSGLDIELVIGNLKDPVFANRALDQITTVVNFTGLKCVKNLVNSDNVKYVDWVISIHSTAIYSKYKALAKEYKEIENYLVESGKRYTIVRPTMIYGSNKDRNISKLISYLNKFRFFPVFGKGTNLLQPIYAKDVAGSVYAILQNRESVANKSYNIAGKYPMTYNELLKTVARGLQRNVTLIHVPYNISYLVVKFLNVIINNVPISTEQIMRMNEDKAYDYKEAINDFGFSPISFDEGITLEILEYEKNEKGINHHNSFWSSK